MTLQKIEFEYDIPDGYRFVRYGIPNKGEAYLAKCRLIIAESNYGAEFPIIEKIPEEEINNKPKFQYRLSPNDNWIDLNDGYEYRIKPKTKTVRFRNYLTLAGNVYTTLYNCSNDSGFKKWLGDWQEVEVEE